ncbi:MAG: hypothetical protein P8L31_12655 [Pseudomonadales bacterium]|nr:hypothetical protein [Pseudomonadales bacterium]
MIESVKTKHDYAATGHPYQGLPPLADILQGDCFPKSIIVGAEGPLPPLYQ